MALKLEAPCWTAEYESDSDQCDEPLNNSLSNLQWLTKMKSQDQPNPPSANDEPDLDIDYRVNPKKPPFSISTLAFLALSECAMSIEDIFGYICMNFAYYNKNRHELSCLMHELNNSSSFAYSHDTMKWCLVEDKNEKPRRSTSKSKRSKQLQGSRGRSSSFKERSRSSFGKGNRQRTRSFNNKSPKPDRATPTSPLQNDTTKTTTYNSSSPQEHDFVDILNSSSTETNAENPLVICDDLNPCIATSKFELDLESSMSDLSDNMNVDFNMDGVFDNDLVLVGQSCKLFPNTNEGMLSDSFSSLGLRSIFDLGVEDAHHQ